MKIYCEIRIFIKYSCFVIKTKTFTHTVGPFYVRFTLQKNLFSTEITKEIYRLPVVLSVYKTMTFFAILYLGHTPGIGHFIFVVYQQISFL